MIMVCAMKNQTTNILITKGIVIKIIPKTYNKMTLLLLRLVIHSPHLRYQEVQKKKNVQVQNNTH